MEPRITSEAIACIHPQGTRLFRSTWAARGALYDNAVKRIGDTFWQVSPPGNCAPGHCACPSPGPANQVARNANAAIFAGDQTQETVFIPASGNMQRMIVEGRVEFRGLVDAGPLRAAWSWYSVPRGTRIRKPRSKLRAAGRAGARANSGTPMRSRSLPARSHPRRRRSKSRRCATERFEFRSLARSASVIDRSL